MKTVKFEIDTDALERSITSLQEETEGLKRDLESLTASMEALNQTWEGAAKEAYMTQYRNDRQNMEILCGERISGQRQQGKNGDFPD